MTPAQYRKWRFYAEALIQHAIDILDALDGEVDLEDGGDGEPARSSYSAKRQRSYNVKGGVAHVGFIAMHAN